jgi:integrase
MQASTNLVAARSDGSGRVQVVPGSGWSLLTRSSVASMTQRARHHERREHRSQASCLRLPARLHRARREVPRLLPPGCMRHAKACPKRKGGWKFTRPKGKRKRTVPIPAQLIAPLRQHFEDQDAGREAAWENWQDWDLVWCEADGRPIDPHDDWDEWKALLAEAVITKDARLHDARHTSGTLLGEQHVDLHVIQRILGHAQVSTTRIYTDPTDPLTREAVGRIGNMLWPDAGQPQREMQRPMSNDTGQQEETPGQDGCAARDLNPEPAD